MSTSAAYVEPVLKTVSVRATPAHAFEVFTAGMDRWWFRTHTINPTKSPMARVVVEPRVGGRWYEQGEDGSECDWGRVLAWEPPGRVLLAWQIGADFRHDPALQTEVGIRFEAEPGGTTRVTLEHRRLERLGAAADAFRTAVNGGWGALLDAFAKTATTA
jgi:uncharacterized protein YndB with AHSA1/START domain